MQLSWLRFQPRSSCHHRRPTRADATRYHTSMGALAIPAALLLMMAAAPVRCSTLYVSLRGNDAWSGTRRAPNGARTDGPLATLEGARDAIRKMKAAGPLQGVVTVRIEPGVYVRTQPFVLEPQDSGSPDAPITYQGEGRVILSGGQVITGFRKSNAGGVWTAPLPDVATWYLGALWVNGQRETLARTPNQGYLEVAGKADPIKDPATGQEQARDRNAFRFKPGDIQDWPDLNRILVVVYHNWEISIHRIQSVDMASRTVTFTGSAPWPFFAGQRYLIENLPGALDAPGEWYLDEPNRVLSYIPRPGEDLSKAEVVLPQARQLVLVNGDYASGQFVQNVHFRNLALYYTGYTIEPQGHADGQAAFSVPATLEMTGARNCSVEQCEIAHTGNYAIWFHAGCQQCQAVQNELHDLGAGGVRIGEGDSPQNDNQAAGHCTVDNNYIHDTGAIFPGSVGVWIGRSSNNVVSHNDIGDMDYTAVSVGWSWGYAASSANNNVIEYNHLHDLGRGVLSDMGAIYSLGVSPGTIERGNVMHDIYCYQKGYGGWGVYTDEGSSDILVENNLVYNTSSGDFHQHYGENNILRNNIFAFGIEGILRRTREETHNSFTIEHNIIVSNGTPFQIEGWQNGYYTLDNNLYWNYADPHPLFYGMSFSDWQAKGHDVHSIIANPGFAASPPSGQPIWKGAAASDFVLKPDSPASQIGFKPFSYDTAGLYGPRSWVTQPARTRRTVYYPPPPPPPTPIADGFEDTPVGDLPEIATVYEEPGKGDSIRVTDETAATGKHSLKLTDAPGLEHVWNPHFYYTPNWKSGHAEEQVDLRVEPGAQLAHEWRDSANPYHVGPAFYIAEDGQMTAGGRPIVKIVPGQWFHVTLQSGLGKEATGSWRLTVRLAGQDQPLVFTDLPCSPDFRSLNWLGYSMTSDKHCVVYLDNIQITPQ